MKKIKLENKTSVCFDETKQKLSNRKQTTHSSEQPELHPYHVIDEEKKKIMRDKLLSWFYKYKRRLPWRGDAPPYTSGTDIRNHINRENCCTLNKYFEMNHSAKSIKNELPLEKTQYQNNSFTTYNRTAYGTWVSEVMLQQTQVSVVIPYWIKWMTKWPTLLFLSKATKEDVYLMWSGLGYYQRALRLLQTAKDIVASWIHRKQRNEVLAGYDTNITLKNLNVTGKNTTLLNTYQEEEEKIKCKENDGQIETLVDYYCNANISTTRLWDVPFPRDSLKQLIEYKGIGDYTAGAILSICFGRRVEAIDGNVIRVVCRLLGIAQVPQSSQLVKIVRHFVSQWICEDDPGSFNEALMELGACICTPSTALCDLCPFASYCVANKESLSKTSNFDLRQMLHTKNSQTPSCTLCEPSYICSAPFPHIYPLKKTKLLRTERISQSVVKRIENCYAFIFYKLEPNTLDVLLTLRPKGLLGDQWGPIVLPKPSSSDDATMHQKSVFSFTDILRECFKESSHNGYFTALRFDETLSSSLLEPLNVGETLVRKTEQVASICQIEMLGSLEHVFSHITHHVTIIGVMLDQLVVFPSTETRYRWIQVGRKNKHKLVTLNLVSSYNQKIMKIFFSHIQ